MNKKTIIILVAILIVIGAFLGYRQNNLNNLHSTEKEQIQNTDGPVCVDDYDPVCGVDNKTHSNECVATKIDNVQVQYKGQCKDTETPEDINKIDNGSSSGTDNGNNTSTDLIDENISTGNINNSGTTSSIGELDGIRLQSYENSNYNYGFSFPYNTYFAGYGSQDGSSHSIGINVGSGITNFDESAVKVFYYKGKTLSELENAEDGGKVVDNENGRTYLKLGDNSIIIESKEGTEDIVQTILKTIYAK